MTREQDLICRIRQQTHPHPRIDIIRRETQTKNMLRLLIWLSILYFASTSNSEDEATNWNPDNSVILRSLGWDPPYFYGIEEPLIDADIGLENADLIEGDIIPDEEDGEDRTATSKKKKLWPKGKIYYVFSSELGENVNDIKTAMKYIESVTCLRFVPRKNEKNYLRIYKGKGCSSKVGMSGGAQDLSLGAGCYKTGKIMHELLHAAGFFHEQSRSDRDKYVNIYWENIKEGAEKNFYKMKPNQELIVTKYDYDSIMHYSETSFSKDKEEGLKTMKAKKKGVVLISPGDKVLSKKDIKMVCIVYRCWNDKWKNKRSFKTHNLHL